MDENQVQMWALVLGVLSLIVSIIASRDKLLSFFRSDGVREVFVYLGIGVGFLFMCGIVGAISSGDLGVALIFLVLALGSMGAAYLTMD